MSAFCVSLWTEERVFTSEEMVVEKLNGMGPIAYRLLHHRRTNRKNLPIFCFLSGSA